ncbi:hypothetical protein JXO52_11890 [bacterium]|nr:hypothetical protein [bacterium]
MDTNTQVFNIACLCLSMALFPGTARGGDIYTFSGTLADVHNSTYAIAGANLTFTSPDGITYPTVQTQADGTFTTAIDTPVEEDDHDQTSLKYSSYAVGHGENTRMIRWSTPIRGTANIKIFNILGQLVDEGQVSYGQGGYHQVNWDMPSNAATQMFLALVEVQDAQGRHILKNMKMMGGSGVGSGFSSVGSFQKTSNATYTESLEKTTNGSYWKLVIDHPDFRTREVLFDLADGGSYNLDLDMISNSFDLGFFDEITYRMNGSGTLRWAEAPQLYIVTDNPSGKTGYRAPTQAQIDMIKDIWKNKIYELTGGEIEVTDSMITLGNDPLGDGAAEIVLDNGNLKPSVGYNVVCWSDLLPRIGAHGEFYASDYNNQENPHIIQGATQILNPWYNPTSPEYDIAMVETMQSLGFPNDPADKNKRWDGTTHEPTELMRQCVKLNYERMYATYSPDRSTVPESI